MVKIIQLCQVCGGKGKFFTQKCSACGGRGGDLIRFDKNIKETLESQHKGYSEQESAILDLYQKGFSQEEIAKKLDITLAKTLLIFYRIEKKINS